MPNVYSQPTAYNGTPQMHGHSIMPQHNMPQLYNPQHMHAYAPWYTAAAIPPYQMGTQHSAVIQQALLQPIVISPAMDMPNPQNEYALPYALVSGA